MQRAFADLLTLSALMVLGCTETKITRGEGASPERVETDPTPALDTGESDPEVDPEEDDTGGIDTRPCAAGEPELQIGTGEDEFETISNGDDIEVIHGTQDGHHILGSLRTKNTTEIVAVRFQIIPTSDGIAISDQTYRLMMLPDGTGEPCAWTTIGLYAYLGRIDPGEAPFLLNTVMLQMDLVDDYGRTVSQALEVFPYVEAVERDPPEPTD